MNPESTIRPGAVTPGGAQLIGWSTAFLTLATAAVVLRFMSRRSTHDVGIDDWAIFAGLVFAYGQYVTNAVLTCVVGFGGYPVKDLSISQFETFLLYQWLDIILWAFTLSTIKFSILLLYRRTFPIPAFIRVIWIVGAIVLSWEVATVVAEICTCTPVQASWRPNLAKHCINAKSFYLGNTITNLMTDVIILCLPMPIIWGLKMSTKRKASVSAVFLLGIIVCVCSLIRIVFLTEIDVTNPTVSEKNASVLSLAEPCIGIVCACLPTLPRLIRSRQRKEKDGRKESSSGESKFSLLRIIQSRLRSQRPSQGSGYVDLEENGQRKKASLDCERTEDVIDLQPMKDSRNTRETPRELCEGRQAGVEEAL